MPPPLRKPPRWFPLVTAVLVVLGTAWAWWTQPPSQLLGHAQVRFGSVVISAPQVATCRSWELLLRLDHKLLPPMPRWILHEGDRPDRSYELHWLPERQVLALYHAPDRFLLGAIALTGPPQTVSFQRRGARFLISVNGEQRLDCTHPPALQEAGVASAHPAWGCWSEGSLGDSDLTLSDRRGSDPQLATRLLEGISADTAGLIVPDSDGYAVGDVVAIDDELISLTGMPHQDDEAQHGVMPVRRGVARTSPQRHQPGSLLIRQPPADAEQRRPDRTLDLLGQAMRNPSDAGPLLAVLSRAAGGRDGQQDGRDPLRHWLAQVSLRAALLAQQQGSSSDRVSADEVRSALDTLLLLTRQEPAPEDTGILLELLPLLTQAAVARPPASRDPALVLARQSWWLATVAEVAAAVDQVGGALLPNDRRYLLQLIEHTAIRLAGAPGLAAPAHGPDWLLVRWRMFAGTVPGAAVLPELPLPRADPLVAAYDQLAQVTALAPLGAVALRARVLDLIDQRAPASAFAPRALDIDDAPAYHLAITQVLLMLSGQLPADPTVARLNLERWIVSDPLAWALDRLVTTRLLSSQDRSEDPEVMANRIRYGLPLPPQPVPGPELAPWAQLLAGGPDADQRALAAADPARLPAAWALAAALSAQEAAGTVVSPASWALLRRIPCFTLPLHLLIPRPPTGHGGDDGPSPLP